MRHGDVRREEGREGKDGRNEERKTKKRLNKEKGETTT